MIVYLNGEFLPQEEAKVSATDRGFLFGDGVYEAIPFYKGNAFGLDGHWKRLQDGLAFLRIEFHHDKEAVLKLFETLLSKNELLKDTLRSMVYVQITRGAPAKRSHAFSDTAVQPTIFATCQEIDYPSPERWNQGFSAALLPDQRWGRVDIKTVNLLANVLAAQEAKERGADEAILVSKEDTITEGSKANVFAFLEGGILVTHPLSQQILPGITRNMVVEEARKGGFVVEERSLTKEELYKEAKEVFITSTTTEMKPIVKIDDKVVGGGTAGEMTKKLVGLLRARIERDTGVALN